MNRRFALAFLALACTALPARADGFGFNVGVGVSFRANCWNGCGPCGPGCGPGCAPLAPWYLYWPMDAHFQTPAPMSYPFWPAPMSPPGAAPTLQPACYYPAPPPYWYGR